MIRSAQRTLTRGEPLFLQVLRLPNTLGGGGDCFGRGPSNSCKRPVPATTTELLGQQSHTVHGSDFAGVLSFGAYYYSAYGSKE